MRFRTVLLLVLVQSLLAGFLALSRCQTDGRSRSLAAAWPQQPVQIRRIVSEQADHRVTLERDEQGRWLVETSTDSDPDGEPQRWPADARLVRQWLREVLEADPRPASGAAGGAASEAGAQSGSAGTRVVIAIADRAEPLKLTLADRPLGGRRPATTPAGDAVTLADTAASLLEPSALQNLRSDAVLPGLDASVFRIQWDSGDGGAFSLRRSGASWSLDAPVRAPADPAQIERLLAALAGLRFEGFDESSPPEQDAPMRLLIESGSMRDGDPSKSGPLQRVYFHGDNRITSRHHDERLLVSGTVSGKGAAFFEGLAASLVDPVALRLPASDIAAISLSHRDGRTLEAVRRAGTWEGSVPVATELLALLTAAEAEHIAIAEDSSGAVENGWRLTVERFGGLPAGVLTLRFDESDTTLVLGSRGVLRRYDAANGSRRAVADWLAARKAAPPDALTASDGG